MKYETDASKAADAKLLPASPQDTILYWKALGITRQTKWVWANAPHCVPLAARFAAAWHIKNGVQV